MHLRQSAPSVGYPCLEDVFIFRFIVENCFCLQDTIILQCKGCMVRISGNGKQGKSQIIPICIICLQGAHNRTDGFVFANREAGNIYKGGFPVWITCRIQRVFPISQFILIGKTIPIHVRVVGIFDSIAIEIFDDITYDDGKCFSVCSTHFVPYLGLEINCRLAFMIKDSRTGQDTLGT